MKVGTVKEIKTHEYRVGLVPASVRELTHHGHSVIVETGCGAGIGFDDDAYRQAGADIMATASEIFEAAEMIVKVKEPQPVECEMLREGQILFTYLHLAADEAQTRALAKSGATCIAYETVTDQHGHLPLLVPMSEVAGRMSIQVGAHYLEKEPGGAGVLLSGVPGVLAGRVCVVGGGVAGGAAARLAMGMEAKVTVLDRSLPRLDELDWRYGAQLNTVYSTVDAVERHVADADLVIGSVLVPGAAAPKVVTEEMIKSMRPGSVVVDIAIDQGGCFETSRPTSHDDPIYTKHGVVHYCVTNMPGAVAQTSTFALNNATLPYTLKLADLGWKKALLSDPGFLEGLNVHEGKVTYEAVAEAVGMDYTPREDVL
ncbi:MAG: alanine dehydrogenase [Alphaproteobacteria bacterium]|nr:alanine dehydrogenase [Alphaproteobacteria bacterium]